MRLKKKKSRYNFPDHSWMRQAAIWRRGASIVLQQLPPAEASSYHVCSLRETLGEPRFFIAYPGIEPGTSEIEFLPTPHRAINVLVEYIPLATTI